MKEGFIPLNPKQRSLFPKCLPTSIMDSKPFTAWGLFSPAKARPKENTPVCEESNISLELSLSLDYTSTAATAIDRGKEEIYNEGNFKVGESNDQPQIKEYKMKNFGEKKSEDVSSELSDVSLELSLSEDYIFATDKGNQKSFEVGECRNQYEREEHNLNNRLKPKVGGLSLQPNLGFDDTCSSKKRERMENLCSTKKVSSSRNKRIKVEREESCKEVSTELRLGPDPWCIKKQLFESDLGNMSRLMLASELVESHIFPFWNADQLTRIKEGLPVSVWDCDTKTEHELVFKQWNKGANVLIKNWVKDFVKRRELKVGDEIGLFWDNYSSRFKFSVLNQAARH